MSEIVENIAAIRRRIDTAAAACGRNPKDITLLAATKQQSVDRISEAIKAGIDAVGENRVQEMLDKLPAYNNIPLHFIGKLQKNKIKSVVGRVALIHSVESEEQAKLIAVCAKAQNLVQDILLEVNIAAESAKSGFLPNTVVKSAVEIARIPGVRLRGLMCIPPKSDIEKENTENFTKLCKILVDIISVMGDNGIGYNFSNTAILSMGMSRDFETAVRCGSTVVRIGTGIFGER